MFVSALPPLKPAGSILSGRDSATLSSQPLNRRHQS